MFTITLVFSVAAILTSNIALRLRSPSPMGWGLGAVFGCCVLPVCLLGSATVLELGFGLMIGVVVTCLLDRRRAYLPVSLAAFAAVIGYNAWDAYRVVERQLDTYPMESIGDRLPERPIEPDTEIPPALVSDLEPELEHHGIHPTRANELKTLHEDTTYAFANRSNFGAMRMVRWDYRMLRVGLREDTLIPQPGERSASADVLESRGTPFSNEKGFWTLHRGSVLDFAHPDGFGYVKDRAHVAGFQSHRFSKVPGGAEPWRVRTLDLIGLVVHREPVAYVSDSLPQMDELRRVPTRRLFPFEELALTELRNGADLHAREMPDGSVRMVGAVRALKQCVDCHGGRRGDLLGAFSYDLRKN